MTPEGKAQSAVYASWMTVTNALDSLAQGVPDAIDRSLFPGLNWAVQNQLIAGLRFLKLIDEHGRTTPQLVSLAEDTENRKENWRRILKDAYSDVFALDLEKISPMQLEQAIQKYGVNGDTLEKAVRFFLNAAEFSGIPLSRHLERRRKPGNTKKRRTFTKIKPDASVESTQDEIVQKVKPASGTSRQVELRSGGSLEVCVSVDLFALSAEDRKFVFGLIDSLQEYEQDSARKEKAADAGTSTASVWKGES